MTAVDIQSQLRSIATPELAVAATRFFKTGPGQYGEGDIFIGIKVPVLRKASREFRSLVLEEIGVLLESPIHEHRHLALMIMVLQAEKADEKLRKRLFDFYLAHTSNINNWDLVDCSAPQVVGGYLFERSRKQLTTLVKSKDLWERRIAIVSTQYFIRRGDYEDTLKLSRLLLDDKEDLIHKATGWMLREVGDGDVAVLEEFLDRHAPEMPRTALRYAIEHFEPDRRKEYLQRK